MEYLSEGALAAAAPLLIGLITKLKSYGYTEWDGQHGDLYGAAFDWRLMPAKMEERDGFLTKTMEAIEKIVAAHPGNKPVVVMGHSMGCKVAHYFLHFCHAQKGRDSYFQSHSSLTLHLQAENGWTATLSISYRWEVSTSHYITSKSCVSLER